MKVIPNYLIEKMKSTVILIFLLIVTSAFGQSEKERIYNLIISFEKALVNKDSVKLKNFLTEDFIGAIPSGEWFDKVDYIKFHCRPGVGLSDLKTEPLEKTNIRIYNTTAIVNRRVSVVRIWPDGQKENLTVQRIEVCVKIKNEWKVASGQGTKVMQGQALPK